MAAQVSFYRILVKLMLLHMGGGLMIIVPNTVLKDVADLVETRRILVSKLDVKLSIIPACRFGVEQYSVGEASKYFIISPDGALYEAPPARNLVAIAN